MGEKEEPKSKKQKLETLNFSTFSDLATSEVGGKILFATDDFFAPAENMISKSEPIWDEHKFTTFGKWMDGWETRRKRTLGHDWCILELGLPGKIVGFDVDTAFFTGNNCPKVTIQGMYAPDGFKNLAPRKGDMGSKCTTKELNAAEAIKSDGWETILDMKPLGSGYPETRHNLFKSKNSNTVFTHLRVNMHPDGGIARLRVFGHVVIDWNNIQKDKLLDLVAVENGGRNISSSNSHYGSPTNLIMPTESAGMYDGWETARNPSRPEKFVTGGDGHLVMPGSDWCIFKLGTAGSIRKVIVDTKHFKGNYPESFLIEGCVCQDDDSEKLRNQVWVTVLSRNCLSADKKHEFNINQDGNEFKPTHIRLTIFPDGGVARLRVFGTK